MIIQSQDLMMSGKRKYSQTMSATYAKKNQPLRGFEDMTRALTKQVEETKDVGETTKQGSPVRLKFEVLSYLLRMVFLNQGKRGLVDSMNEEELPQQWLGQGLGMGFQLETTEAFYRYEETEETQFSTEGKVVTSDGREISFQVELGMSRSFCEEYYERVEALKPAMCDPLVINMDIDTASVRDQKFYFDLDCDGEEEALSMLSAGSGFLALDKNGDGVINNGSELFGTKSGNGFYDLAQYDLDGNGWIDEADEVFDRLQIWVPNEDGSSTCYKLKDKGVGAICLQNVGTDFTLKDSKQETGGAIRRTGIFLMESGRAGTVQHVDLAM